MNEKRLKELEKRVSFYQDDLGNDYFEGPLECKDLRDLIAAARRCNELEAENAALKDVNWDISYPDGESLATIKAERDAMEKHADDVTQMLTMCQAERDALKEEALIERADRDQYYAFSRCLKKELNILGADNERLKSELEKLRNE